MKKIPLSQGKFALVDDCDYDFLRKFTWCVNNGYGSRKDVTGHDVKMHRVILTRMGFKDFLEVDHRNENTVNNRRKNLRPANKSEQSCNRGLRRDNKSGYKGVHFHKLCGKWWAYINKDGQRYNLGFFDNPKEAARAYNEAAKRLHGEFAWLNKVD